MQIFDDHVDWVLETPNATLQVRIETSQGKLLFDAIGAHTGLEVMGDLPRLLHG